MNYKNIEKVFENLQHADIQKKTFAQFGTQKITYGKLLEDIQKLHQLFDTKGLKKGDRIILSTEQDYYTALFFLAFLRYGITTVLIDVTVPKERALAIAKKSEVRGYVMDEALFKERSIGENAEIFVLKIQKKTKKKGKLFKRLLKKKKKPTPQNEQHFPAILSTFSVKSIVLPSIEPSDLAYFLFTSGTTAAPKGVMISHHNLFSHLDTLTRGYGLNKESKILNILMLYHADGLIQGPLLTAANEATWVCPFRFEVSRIDELFNAIYKYRISHFVTVPTILSFMEKFSEGFKDSFITEDFKYIISCGAKLESNLWETFEQKFQVPVINVYGLTETVAGGFFSGLFHIPRKIGTIGMPVDCQARLITEEGTTAKDNEYGNLWLKGDLLFVGYVNDEEATKQVMEEGWFNTGDVAVRDEEGFYTITGRTKNMINYGGVNIYPEQVTEIINTHPFVLESVCVGMSDEFFGEKIVSAVTLLPEKELTVLELISYLRTRLEANQIPKEIYFFDKMPKGLSGKIQVKKVKQEMENRGKYTTNKEEIATYQEAVKEAASSAFNVPVDRLDMKVTSVNLEGWDSMGHLLFITNLEKRFNLRFSTAEIMRMNSLKTAKDILMKKIEKS